MPTGLAVRQLPGTNFRLEVRHYFREHDNALAVETRA
jgi:hypothetical protein